MQANQHVNVAAVKWGVPCRDCGAQAGQSCLRDCPTLDGAYLEVERTPKEPVVMVYRPGLAHPATKALLDGISAEEAGIYQWQTMIISERNSAVTNGKYDLVAHYEDQGKWEIHLLPFPEGDVSLRDTLLQATEEMLQNL